MPKNSAWPNENWPPKPPRMFQAWASRRRIERHHDEIEHDARLGQQGRARHHRGEQGDRGQVLHARAPNRPCGRSKSTPMKIAKMPIWPSDSPRYKPAQRLDHADQQAADQRAGETAHAAEHDDGEGDQHEAAADLRVDVVGRQQEAGGRAQAGQPDAEAHGIDMLDVDAHQAGALLFLGHGADGPAEVGA